MNIKDNKTEKSSNDFYTLLAVVFPTCSKNATEALQFYEDTADMLSYLQTSKKDNGFDWDRCRAYCKIGKTYSLNRYMEYIAMQFNTTKEEMKNQWRNINYR